MAKAKLTIKKDGVVQTPKNNKILGLIDKHKNEICGGITFGLGVLITSIFADKAVKGTRAYGYQSGFHDGMIFGHDYMLHDIPGMDGMDPNNVLVTWDDEFKDADFAMEKNHMAMNHLYANGFAPNNIKKVREVMFIETDHRTHQYDKDTIIGFKEPSKK